MNLIDIGIKECIVNSNNLLDLSKTMLEKKIHTQSIVFFYHALSEFGKAVLLRDRKKVAEYKNQLEIDVSDFFYDHYKKIDAAVRSTGPHVELIKFNKTGSQGIMEFLEFDSKDSSDICSLMLMDFNSGGAKWEPKLTTKILDLNSEAFVVLTKMLKKWQSFY